MSADGSPGDTGISNEVHSSVVDTVPNGVNGNGLGASDDAESLGKGAAEEGEEEAGDDLFGDEEEEDDAVNVEKKAYV